MKNYIETFPTTVTNLTKDGIAEKMHQTITNGLNSTNEYVSPTTRVIIRPLNNGYDTYFGHNNTYDPHGRVVSLTTKNGGVQYKSLKQWVVEDLYAYHIARTIQRNGKIYTTSRVMFPSQVLSTKLVDELTIDKVSTSMFLGSIGDIYNWLSETYTPHSLITSFIPNQIESTYTTRIQYVPEEWNDEPGVSQNGTLVDYILIGWLQNAGDKIPSFITTPSTCIHSTWQDIQQYTQVLSDPGLTIATDLLDLL